MRRLLIRPGAIGDCLCALPALCALRGTHETVIWTNGALAPLIGFGDRSLSLASTGFHLLGIPGAELPPGLLEMLGRFDEILSWSGINQPILHARAADHGLPIHFFPALPEPTTAGHVSDYFFQQTQYWSGLREEPAAWRKPGGRRFLLTQRCLRPCIPNEIPLVVLHPFSGSPAKNWPLGNFRRLAESLQGQFDVRWCASPEDPLPRDLIGQAWRYDNLCTLAFHLSRARLYVGNDSGITHLAAMLGIPTVVFFGPVSPHQWHPRGAPVFVVQTPEVGQSATAISYESGEQMVRSALLECSKTTGNTVY